MKGHLTWDLHWPGALLVVAEGLLGALPDPDPGLDPLLSGSVGTSRGDGG